ncbi:hypothetical protein Q4Q39_09385 [Flavivirga amylovorans]|uniref:Uncharacterized protein n=1 Tax=Flavivirga amylovorans TaxID=870486 RepID=A0ABT8X1X7_9FLAO|nr:hypothetical protein [Flavivirga amylovorans]MDO5987609.1 hypothetical protein [Flavivirga amylovorans]
MESYIKIAIKYLISTERSFLLSSKATQIVLYHSLHSSSLHTQKLTKSGDMLFFNYDSYNLEWRTDRTLIDGLSIKHHEHFEVVRWIETMAIEAGIRKPYVFDLFLIGMTQDFNPQYKIPNGMHKNYQL